MKFKINDFVFFILFSGVSIVQANLPELKYQIIIPTQNADSPELIRVHLQMNGVVLENSSYVFLYAGKIQVQDLAARSTVPLPVTRQENFVIIGPLAQKQVNLQIQYAVAPGRLAKHGHQGFLSENLALFGGEQLFLIPAGGRAASISVHFCVPPAWMCILPQIEIKHSLEISDSSWLGIYNLMKNNYACGQFEKFALKNQTIWFPQNTLSEIHQQKIMRGTQKIIHFFETHFQHSLENYQLCFTTKSPTNEYLMGGIGPASLGFTLEPDALRDWQLLAHRLFHVFFDRVVHLKPLYTPPWLWLQEALAGYYEILAPAVLSTEFSQYRPKKIFAELYRRYLYFYFKDRALFQIAPTQEKNLAYEGQTEFLHYTQAPLTVFALIHEILRQNPDAPPNLLWQWLSQIEPETLAEMPANLGNFSNLRLTAFFAEHVYGVKLLELGEPLRDFAEKIDSDRAEIIKSLQEYEYLLWTWFRHVPEVFPEKSIDAEHFEKLLELALKKKITFATSAEEKQVHEFSPTVYGLLKIHFLRLAICGIDPAAPTRNQQFQMPVNQQKWQNFLARLKD